MSNIESQILNLMKKKEYLMDDNTNKREQIVSLQDKINNNNEDIQEIDKDIESIKYNSAQDRIDDNDIDKKPLADVEEDADAAITTGALDASSVSNGGDYGGWKHYSKIGDTKKRDKKNIYKFMDEFWK